MCIISLFGVFLSVCDPSSGHFREEKHHSHYFQTNGKHSVTAVRCSPPRMSSPPPDSQPSCQSSASLHPCLRTQYTSTGTECCTFYSSKSLGVSWYQNHAKIDTWKSTQDWTSKMLLFVAAPVANFLSLERQHDELRARMCRAQAREFLRGRVGQRWLGQLQEAHLAGGCCSPKLGVDMDIPKSSRYL